MKKRILLPSLVWVFVLGVMSAAMADITPALLPRITVQGDRFIANGSPIFMNGANTPYHHFEDFGRAFDEQYWDLHFSQFVANGLNSSRVRISCHGHIGIMQIDENGYVSGATDQHWEDVDKLFDMAERHGIYLMLTLIANDHFFVAQQPDSAPRWIKWINSDSNIDSWINNYLIPFLTRYGHRTVLWSIDLANEVEFSTTIENAKAPLDYRRLQMFVARASKVIHERSDVLVTVNTIGLKYNSESKFDRNWFSDSELQSFVNDPDTKIDFWGPHQYEWNEKDCGGNGFHRTPEDFGMDPSKPTVMGECSTYGSEYSKNLGGNLYDDLEDAYSNGWGGVFPWSSNFVDRYGGWTNVSNAANAFVANHYAAVFPHLGNADPVKVACVGGSITDGDPNPYGYTPFLANELGAGYSVVAYGSPKATALAPGRGSAPFVSTTKHVNALASGSDVVVIMLGTHDSSDTNWTHQDQFKNDLRSIVTSYTSLTPAPKVYLATPPPAFTNSIGVKPDRVGTIIGPWIRELANELNVQGIDTYCPFVDRSDLFRNGVLPTSAGNALLGQIIHDAVTAGDDTTAPSTPSGVTAFPSSGTSVHLSWNKPNGEPTGYEVYRDGICIGVVPSPYRYFEDTGLTTGIHKYSVRAFDRALNLSSKSAEVSADTRIIVDDNVAPSVPSGLNGSPSGTSLTLSWEPSTDNLGVSGYEIQRGSTVIANQAATSLIDSGLTRDTRYSYSVRAYDAIGNTSNYCTAIQVLIPPPELPAGWDCKDIGSIALAGEGSADGGVFTLKASGADIYGSADSFGYTYTSLTGDGSVTARVTAMENTHEWAKCGVMIRETLEPGSKHASMVITPFNKVSFQYRTSGNSSARPGISASFDSTPMWVRITRTGNTITGSYSSNGSTWTTLTTQSIEMNATLHVGLALSSHDNSRLNTATIDNVTISGGTINQPPVLQGIGNQTVRAGETIRFTIQATDPDAGPEPLQYSASGD